VTSCCINVLQQYVELFSVASGTVKRYVHAARHRWCIYMRKSELIDALRFDDNNRNDDAEDQAVCEQDDQNLRYDIS